MRGSAPVRAVMRGLLVLLTAAVVCVVAPAISLAAEIEVTPSTFGSAFAGAGPGDTLLLASGDYGTFRGAMKSGEVTIKAQEAATPVMALSFAPASNITLDGLRIRDGYLADSRTKNITVRNSDFDRAQVVFRTGSLANANILFERNRHTNRDVCSGCYDGRISLVERREDAPSGITIRDSLFEGGTMDGILNGSNGTQITGNEFRAIQQTTSGDIAHTDSIQLYGSKNTLIKGNYFHDVAVGVMCADGCEREVIEDNVFAVNGSPYAVTLLSDNASTIRHNTFLDYGTCDYRLRCGVLYLGNKSVDPPSAGTALKDNIITRVCVCDGTTAGLADEGHNLFTQTSWRGPGDLLAQPVYVGGARPTTYEGFRLAEGSPGKGTASDGLDRGARFGDTPAAQPEPAPNYSAAPIPPAPSNSAPVILTRSSLNSIASTGKLRLKVRTAVPGRITLRSTIRPVVARQGHHGRFSRKSIRLRSTTRTFKPARTRTVTIRVPRAARRTLGRSRSARLSIRSYAGTSGNRLPLGTHTLRIKR